MSDATTTADTDEEAAKPNPGSDEARTKGCICPVLDNNHGKMAPWPPDGWWMDTECPLHGRADVLVPQVVPPE